LLLTLFWVGTGFVWPGPPKCRQPYSPQTGAVRRVVALAPNLTEILFALGLDSEVVGVSAHSNYPAAARKRAKVGTFWQPNIEAIIAAKADLVIGLGFTQQRDAAMRLQRMGYRSLVVNIETVEGFFEAVEVIGRATSRTVEARQLQHDIQAKLGCLSTMLKDRPQQVRVLWVVQRQPLRVAGRGTFVNELIELAGGANAIGPTVYKYPPIGVEMLYACKPDVIIEPTMQESALADQQRQALRYWSRFTSLPAVRGGRIYVIAGDTVSRLGPRLYEAAETVAACLWPRLFETSE